MDVAYDHIQEEVLQSNSNAASSSNDDKKPEAQSTLNAEFQDAYRAFSSSPWGAKIGGFFGSVVKQVSYCLPQLGNSSPGTELIGTVVY